MKDNKRVLCVKGNNAQENTKGDRKATVTLKGAARRGENVLKLVIEAEEAKEFSLGDFYEVSFRPCPAPEKS